MPEAKVCVSPGAPGLPSAANCTAKNTANSRAAAPRKRSQGGQRKRLPQRRLQRRKLPQRKLQRKRSDRQISWAVPGSCSPLSEHPGRCRSTTRSLPFGVRPQPALSFAEGSRPSRHSNSQNSPPNMVEVRPKKDVWAGRSPETEPTRLTHPSVIPDTMRGRKTK